MTATAETPLSLAETATLVHGFTMRDVQRAAQVAARRTSYYPLDDEDREQTAWHGVVEFLYMCGCGWGSCNRPAGVTWYDLLFAGMGAVSKEADEISKHHGFTRKNPDFLAPRFSQYWGTDTTKQNVLPSRKPKRRVDDGFSEHLCERLTLPSVLGLLTPGQYEALVTLAAYDNDNVAAAAALGANYRTFNNQVQNARRRIKEAWFDDETPPAPKGSPDTCRSGHSKAEHGHVVPSSGKWVCRVCDRAARRRRYYSNSDERRAYHRRWKKHQRGDHSECLPENCDQASPASTSPAQEIGSPRVGIDGQLGVLLSAPQT